MRCSGKVEKISDACNAPVKVLSSRLLPYEVKEDTNVVRAALAARRGSTTSGSSAFSDLAHFRDIDGVKVGPGDTKRSHTPDEFIHEEEILDGAQFYERLVRI